MVDFGLLYFKWPLLQDVVSWVLFVIDFVVEVVLVRCCDQVVVGPVDITWVGGGGVVGCCDVVEDEKFNVCKISTFAK